MKKRINFLMIFSLVLVIVFGGTACMKNPKKIEPSGDSTSGGQASKTSDPTNAIEFTDKQIIEAILTEYNGYSKEDGAKYADIAMSRALKLTDRDLGSITSEEDAKEKAEAVWMEIDKGIFEDIKETFVSEEQPYVEAFFYEKYDAWYLRTPISGITKDGKSFGLTGGFRIIIRKADGKILGVW